VTSKKCRPGAETGAATDYSAADLKSKSTVATPPDRAPWTMQDVMRLHNLGLHVFPLRHDKRPVGRWRKGDVDFVKVKPTDDNIEEWANREPAGWCILCGGPARILVLDVEAAGIADLSEKGERIRQVLDRFPASCKRPSPSGGQHAVLYITDGPVPDGHGHKLIWRLDGVNEQGKQVKTLLAEYRGDGSYAGVLGHGRGPLQPDFAPHDVTLAELQELLVDLREVSDVSASTVRVSEGSSGYQSGPNKAAKTHDALAKLPLGPLCDAVTKQLDKIVKLLANGPRNAAVQGPLLQLVRLGQRGHHGVLEAAELIQEDFVGRITPSRAGGATEAEQEWSRLLDGAIRIVFPKGVASRPPAPCVCILPSLRLAMRQDRFFSTNGRAKVTERSVLAYLLNRAEDRRDLRLEVAQRVISEAIDFTQHTMSTVLGRLEKRGWVNREHQRMHGASDFITLTLPTCVVTTSTSTSSKEDSLVDVVTNAYVHRLFGPMGLGPGLAGTFNALPEWDRAVRHGRLIRVMPGSPPTELLLNPQQGKRRIPAAPIGPGLTVKELVRKTGKARGTVIIHLRKLSQAGLVFCDDKGRWWRFRFDPDDFADSQGLAHTTHLKAVRHISERRSYFDGLIAQAKSKGLKPRVERVSDEDGVRYVHTVTGEVLWVDLRTEDESDL
jgi:predicted transcriptional regulator/DNA-binding transcriptional ArsR family regulator